MMALVTSSITTYTYSLSRLLQLLLLLNSQIVLYGLTKPLNIRRNVVNVSRSINQTVKIKNLGIIIPAYNEENRILQTLGSYQDYFLNYRALPEFLDANTNIKIIIVDDGSSDNTVAKIRRFREISKATEETIGKQTHFNIDYLSLDKNRGKGAAIARGVQELQQIQKDTKDSYILITDADASADIQTSFEKLRPLMRKSNSSPPDLIIGNRLSTSKNTSLLRLILRYGFRAFVRVCGGLGGVKDTQCGFKFISQDLAHVLYTNLHLMRWTHDVEVCFLASKLNVTIENVDVNWEEKEGSKLVDKSVTLDLVLVIIGMIVDILIMRFMYFFRRWNIPEYDNAKKRM